MAIKIEFEGYVQEVRKLDWGVVYNVSHRQSKQNAQGQWEVVGYDNFEVTSEGNFEKGDRVRVMGNFKSRPFQRQDGSKGLALHIWAKEMTKVAKPASMPEMQTIWPEVREIPNTPF
jgi:single-stranded DNA-binding protein